MTDMTVKTRKSLLRTCACTYAGKSFIYYPSYPSSVTLEDERLKMYEKQVHVFGKTGAPI